MRSLAMLTATADGNVTRFVFGVERYADMMESGLLERGFEVVRSQVDPDGRDDRSVAETARAHALIRQIISEDS